MKYGEDGEDKVETKVAGQVLLISGVLYFLILMRFPVSREDGQEPKMATRIRFDLWLFRNCKHGFDEQAFVESLIVTLHLVDMYGWLSYRDPVRLLTDPGASETLGCSVLVVLN